MTLRVAIAGSGKVASAMARRMREGGTPAAAILARNRNAGAALADNARSTFLPLEELPTGTQFDLILLCVADSAVSDVARLLKPYASHLLHVSGTVPLAALGAGKHGVFYPLMTFPAETEPDWKGVRVFTEATHPQLEELLPELAALLQVTAVPADGRQRFQLHLAAVFANNFTVASVRAAKSLLDEAGQPLETLLPLMRATFQLLLQQDPDQVQTGPAQRGDISTMDAHAQALAGHPELQEMYRAISQFIDSRRDFD